MFEFLKSKPRPLSATSLLDSDTYEITVKFSRSVSDDFPFIEQRMRDKNLPLREAIVSQFAAEIQDTLYDKGGVAGFFKVVDVELGK